MTSTQSARHAEPITTLGPPATTPPKAPAPLRTVGSIAFRPDIEGMRALAVLLVVAYHAGLGRFVGGFVGVDVFFVLSGYLITQILVSEMERTGGIRFRQFYARRARRLLPAASLVVVVTLVADLMLLSPLERIDLSFSAVATALYSSNIFFLVRATDYFALGADGNPLLHTWSLAVEEQFYLVWPVLVLLGFRLMRSRRGLALTLSGVSVVSFALSIWLTYRNQPWAFFGTPARAWEFGIGGLACLVVLPAGAADRSWRSALGWAGLALVLASAFVVRATSAFPGYLALLPTIGTTMVLIAGSAAADRGGTAPLLNGRVMQWLGAHSYSWYLWHWPALVFGLVAFPSMDGLGRAACVLGALGVAAITQRLVEHRIRFHPGLVQRPALSLVLAAVLTLGTAGVASAVYRTSYARGARYWHAANDVPHLVAAGCATDYTESRPRLCSFGDTTSTTGVVLLGDSHAIQWSPAMERIATAHHWKLVTMVKFSCPLARVAVYNRVLKRPYTECDDWREQALRRAIAMHPAFVAIGQFEHAMPETQLPGGSLRRLTYAEWLTGFRSTLATLDSAGVQIIVIGDSPTIGVPVPMCLSRAEHFGRPTTTCAAPRARALNAKAHDAVRAAGEGLSRVHYVDLTDQICGDTLCEPIRNGVIAYRDRNHLSPAFVEHLAPQLESRMLSELPGVTP